MVDEEKNEDKQKEDHKKDSKKVKTIFCVPKISELIGEFRINLIISKTNSAATTEIKYENHFFLFANTGIKMNVFNKKVTGKVIMIMVRSTFPNGSQNAPLPYIAIIK